MQSSEFRASIDKFPSSPLAEWPRIAAISSIFDANGIGCKPCQEEVPHNHIINADLGTLCRRMSWFGELFLSLLLPFLLVNPYFDPAILLSTWPEESFHYTFDDYLISQKACCVSNLISVVTLSPQPPGITSFYFTLLWFASFFEGDFWTIRSPASSGTQTAPVYDVVKFEHQCRIWPRGRIHSQHSNWSILCGWSQQLGTKFVQWAFLAAQTCPALAPFANGERILEFGDGTGYGTVFRFECAPGFRRIGAATLLCQANGKWSFDQPSCKSKYYILRNVRLASCFHSEPSLVSR